LHHRRPLDPLSGNLASPPLAAGLWILSLATLHHRLSPPASGSSLRQPDITAFRRRPLHPLSGNLASPPVAAGLWILSLATLPRVKKP